MFDRISEGLYWDKPWSLVSGCTPCSPGCKHCWALAMERRFYSTECKGFDGRRKVGTHPERLDIPLKRKKPTVFACWNDLLHEDVPQGFIWDALEIMAQASWHIFLLLTKRPKRLLTIRPFPKPYLSNAPNIWLGCTVCNQAEADEKIPILLQIPAAVRFLSIEPMLGPVKISKYLCSPASCEDWGLCHGNHRNICSQSGKIGWVVLGGESGPGARPMNPDWVRSVRDQCVSAGVPFYFKQWGEWGPTVHRDWTEKEQVWMDNTNMFRMGRKYTGRLLDGKEYNELPEVHK